MNSSVETRPPFLDEGAIAFIRLSRSALQATRSDGEMVCVPRRPASVAAAHQPTTQAWFSRRLAQTFPTVIGRLGSMNCSVPIVTAQRLLRSGRSGQDYAD